MHENTRPSHFPVKKRFQKLETETIVPPPPNTHIVFMYKQTVLLANYVIKPNYM